MSSGIYRIVNLINGKSYVGQADNLVRRRWEHFYDLKNGDHRNDHLQKSYNKYGKDSFKFEILEIVVIPDEFLTKAERQAYLVPYEQYWMDKYDSASKKNGYNMSAAAGSMRGFRHTQETLDGMVERKSNCAYRITKPDGTTEDTVNLRRFCRDNDLSESVMYKVAAGNQDRHRGFGVVRLICIGGDIKTDSNLSDEHRKNVANALSVNQYLVIYPDESELVVTNLNQFCKDNGLDSSSAYSVSSGRLKQYKGFKFKKLDRLGDE